MDILIIYIKFGDETHGIHIVPSSSIQILTLTLLEFRRNCLR